VARPEEDLGYQRTLIAVADDCPVEASVVPQDRRGAPTVAGLQYAMLAGHPYEHTQQDVLFHSWLARQRFAEQPSRAEVARLRAEFFAKPQACLRASPLPKKYGWGFLFDEEGKVALCAVESEEYQRIAAGKGGGVTLLKALRSKRA
jgi:hypothetical protein